MPADNKEGNAPLSVTDRYAQLGSDIKKRQPAEGRATTRRRADQPVGTDAHQRARDESEKAIKERQALRIGRTVPDSIRY